MREDLRELPSAVAYGSFETSAEGFVQVGARGFGRDGVRHVPHEQVLEAITVRFAGLTILDHQAGAAKARQRTRQIEIWCERAQLARAEPLSHDRRDLHGTALAVGETVEPRGKQRVDAFGHANVRDA